MDPLWRHVVFKLFLYKAKIDFLLDSSGLLFDLDKLFEYGLVDLEVVSVVLALEHVFVPVRILDSLFDVALRIGSLKPLLLCCPLIHLPDLELVVSPQFMDEPLHAHIAIVAFGLEASRQLVYLVADLTEL